MSSIAQPPTRTANYSEIQALTARRQDYPLSVHENIELALSRALQEGATSLAQSRMLMEVIHENHVINGTVMSTNQDLNERTNSL